MTPGVAHQDNAALPYGGDNAVGLSSRTAADRHLTRYVFGIGDHIEPADKIHLRSIGGWAGGIWIGASEVGGAPTMFRTNHMAFRCGIIPLETTSISRKADHREVEAKDESYLTGPNVSPETRGYTVYAGDDLNNLQNDQFRQMDLVELTELKGNPWANGVAMRKQNQFFPNWSLWAQGVEPMPFLLSDMELIVSKAPIMDETDEIIQYEMLESARLFRRWAETKIEGNRQVILGLRNSDNKGFFVGWTERVKLYAKQLGVQLEDATRIAPATDNTEITAAMKADQELRREELEVQKQTNARLMDLLETVMGNKPKVEDIPAPTTEVKPLEFKEPTEEDLLKDVTTGEVVTLECSELTKNQEPCKGYVDPKAQVEGEPIRCARHAAMAKKKEEGSSEE